MESTKMVIVMRTDLNMRKGKMIAQGGHAVAKVLLCDRQLSQFCGNQYPVQSWLNDGLSTKICVRVNSEEELMDLFGKASDAGIEAHVVTDSGLTEFNGVPTKTCMAIGPDYSSKIDQITGHLQLL